MDEMLCFADAFVKKSLEYRSAREAAQEKELSSISRWQDEVAIAIGQLFPTNDHSKLENCISFLSKMKTSFIDRPELYKRLISILKDCQRQLFISPEIYELFKNTPDLLEDVKQFLPEGALSDHAAAKSSEVATIAKDTENRPFTLTEICSSLRASSQDGSSIKNIQVEDCGGFIQVPIGLAGPLRINGENQQQTVFAPLATVEPSLTAACSRGCRVFQVSGGVRAIALGEGMSQTAVFRFLTVDDAVKFYQYIPCAEQSFRASIEITNKYARLVKLVSHILGKTVSLNFVYICSDATVLQTGIKSATQCACQNWMKSTDAKDFHAIDFQLDGPSSSNKGLSRRKVPLHQGVQVLVWGTVSNEACQEVFGCTTAVFHQDIMKDRSMYNGRIGHSADTANLMAAIFTACGHAANVLECSWSRPTAELDSDSQKLTLSLYFPSVAAASIGGETQYPTQQEALKLIGCYGSGKKRSLAETVAAFALALNVGTFRPLCNEALTESHFASAPDLSRL